MKMTRRTELASEFTARKSGVSCESYELYGEKITEILISEDDKAAFGRSSGRYYTIDSGDVPYVEGQIRALCTVFRKLLPEGKCLVAGLGNPSVASDSLGWKTAGKVLATSQFVENMHNSDGIGNIAVIRTDVSANSGIDSVYHAVFCAEKISADYIIAIDSLTCSDPERLCRTIQITDAGIAPGSGIGGSKKQLDRQTAGIPVIAVGVPTSMEYENGSDKFFVTRHDIDIEIARYSHVISTAINHTLCPLLSQSDIAMLMNYS